MTTRYRLPSKLTATATTTSASDWSLIQKAGESWVSKIPAGTFGPLLCTQVYGTWDTNTGIAFPGSDVIVFYEGGGEAMRITSDGYLQMPTGAELHRPGQSNTVPVYSFVADPDTGVGNDTSNDLTFITAGSPRAVVGASGNFRPWVTDTYSLGTSGISWSDVYTKNAPVVGSDAREKTDIETSDLGLSFIQLLRPVKYRWIAAGCLSDEGQPQTRPGMRPHYGLLAQEVLAAMGEADFAGYIYNPETDSHGLRYSEFIAPLIKAVQELAARVEKLEAATGGAVAS